LLSSIDYFILGLFLIGLPAFGWYQSRFNHTIGDYFLGGKTLPWAAAMFSIVATETSVLTFISVPGLAYQKNWLFLQLAMGYILGRILVTVVLLPGYFSQGVTSIYEVLGEKFGTEIQKIASAVFLVTRILADGVRFLATAVIVQVITGWSLSAAVIIIGVITLMYSLLGGIRAVIWVDGFQFLLYLAGGLISIYFLLSFIELPITGIYESLSSQGKLTLFQFEGNVFEEPFMFFSALTGGVFLSFASHGADYMMVQRVLATRDLDSARKAMIGSGFFVFLQFSIFLLIGSLIYIYFGGMDIEKDREFPTFIIQHLPAGIKGILLAGVLSAAMSTLSSSINSLASSTVTDWLKGSATVKTSQLISLAWGVVLIVIALLFDESDTAIVVIGLQIASFTYGGLLGLFILSRLRRSFHVTSLIVGLLASLLIVFYLKHAGLAWTWYVCISVIVNMVITTISDILIKGFKAL
jgi:SSS family transporter|tara:strand:- start:851 stop:2254 length:1404 start_codon:yes stop_codon:yes gene_type:complete